MTNSLFPNFRGEGTGVCYRDVYRDVSKRRQIGRAFKLMNPKHMDPASVHMTLSLSLNLLVCWAKVCKQCAYF